MRTLERTATFMPMKPVTDDSTAPITNPIADLDAEVVGKGAGDRDGDVTTTATTAMVVYWRFRYAAAPSWIAAAISRMRSLPCGCFSTHCVSRRP